MAAISVIPGDMDTGEYLMKKLSKILAGTCFGIVSHLRRKSNIRKFGFNASLTGAIGFSLRTGSLECLEFRAVSIRRSCSRLCHQVTLPKSQTCEPDHVLTWFRKHNIL